MTWSSLLYFICASSAWFPCKVLLSSFSSPAGHGGWASVCVDSQPTATYSSTLSNLAVPRWVRVFSTLVRADLASLIVLKLLVGRRDNIYRSRARSLFRRLDLAERSVMRKVIREHSEDTDIHRWIPALVGASAVCSSSDGDGVSAWTAAPMIDRFVGHGPDRVISKNLWFHLSRSARSAYSTPKKESPIHWKITTFGLPRASFAPQESVAKDKKNLRYSEF
jgi:hypothetical protein